MQNGTYSKRGKSDDMSKCKGTDDCLGKDRFGHSKATSCPLCKSGQSVAKKLAEIKRRNKRKEWRFGRPQRIPYPLK